MFSSYSIVIDIQGFGWCSLLGTTVKGRQLCEIQICRVGTKQAERAVGVARAACFEPLARRIRQRWCLTTGLYLRTVASLNIK